MIVYERDDVWVMTAQDDHARFSGAAAGFWKDESLTGSVLYEDVRLAIQEHDRGWIPLDVHPMWNDREQRPYSFRDLPVGLKLPYYRQGVDEVQERNEYAALLNSLHYASFFHEDRIGGLGDIEKDGVDRFLAWEQQRRGAIKAGNGWTGEKRGRISPTTLRCCSSATPCRSSSACRSPESLSASMPGLRRDV
ncbi:DUF3891 family protein [Paenibacillus sp. CC-CFT747]|nr:DUF3891 family protein [Paenibacillus sp. CC-CFT747]